MECVDAHPDRQMNCVNKSGCLHFVKTFIKDQQKNNHSKPTDHTKDINQENQNLSESYESTQVSLEY